MPRKKPGPPKGHPGWGGRKPGPHMPCGWCGKPQAAAQMRKHFAACPKRPKGEKRERFGR